jgi:hypothetical protein
VIRLIPEAPTEDSFDLAQTQSFTAVWDRLPPQARPHRKPDPMYRGAYCKVNVPTAATIPIWVCPSKVEQQDRESDACRCSRRGYEPRRDRCNTNSLARVAGRPRFLVAIWWAPTSRVSSAFSTD